MATKNDLLKLLDGAGRSCVIRDLTAQHGKLSDQLAKIVANEKKAIAATINRTACFRVSEDFIGGHLNVVEKVNGDMGRYHIHVLGHKIPAFVKLKKQLANTISEIEKQKTAWKKRVSAVRTLLLLHGATPENVAKVEGILSDAA